jgi:hypothetical protein
MKNRDELVEKMVNSCFGTTDSGLERMCEFGAARCMLSVIEKHIAEHPEEWVKVCPECRGECAFEPYEGFHPQTCYTKGCNGTGVVAKVGE